MPETSDYILVLGVAYNLAKLAADPVLRAELLEKAKRKRATRQYRNLVHRLAEHDAATGAVPLILKKIEDCPERTGRQILATSKGRSKPGFWGARQHAAAKRLEEKSD